MTDLADTIRAAIADSGKSWYRLGKESTVSQQKIGDLMRGKGMTLRSASKLCRALGLELRPIVAGVCAI